MKKIFLILSLLILFNSLFAQETFTSKKYNFKITFPDKWDIEKNKNDYIVKGMKNDYTGITISVRKIALPDSITIKYISLDSLSIFVSKQMESNFRLYDIMKKGENKIDGVDAYYFFIRYTDEKDGYPTTYMSFQYQFVFRGYFYSMFAISPYDDFIYNDKQFNDIYATFSFLKRK